MEKMSGNSEQKREVIDFRPGPIKIIDAMSEMVELAKREGVDVRADINEIEVVVGPDTDPSDAYRDYLDRQHQKAEKYRRSPERARRDLESFNRSRNKQMEIYRLIDQLPEIDFSDQEAILDWLSGFTLAGSDIGTNTHSEMLIEIFADHGYVPDVKKDQNESRESIARFLIGQALTSLRDRKSIFQAFPIMVKDWKENYKI